MKNELDEYDTDKLRKAKKLVLEVYEYNYVPLSSLTKRLDTILRKIDAVINKSAY